jgi:hypothetical protein
MATISFTPDKKQAIYSHIFGETKWQDVMASLGFLTLLLGSDLERFDTEISSPSLNSSSAGEPAYLALVLANKNSEYPLELYKEGFPHKELFLGA